MSRTGIVNTWVEERGFGFISPNDGSMGDLFVHIDNIKDRSIRNLKRGDRVRYDIEMNTNPTKNAGKRLAINVELRGGGGGGRERDRRGDRDGGYSRRDDRDDRGRRDGRYEDRRNDRYDDRRSRSYEDKRSRSRDDRRSPPRRDSRSRSP
mmetsp:Transcript_7536/g.13593  ORF Transcript_7536/g.13593 Transcript_7536/m.13593 type:complete len:151 (+) Transcript_7536:79-531(+)